MNKNRKLRNITRSYIATIWKIHKIGGSLKEEDKRLADILEEHKEYHKIWEIADKIVDVEYTVEGVNPFLHIQIHLIVENQLAMGEPSVVREVAEELNKLGFSHHEIIHIIARPLTKQIFYIFKNNVPFNEEEYTQDLRKIVEDIKGDRRT